MAKPTVAGKIFDFDDAKSFEENLQEFCEHMKGTDQVLADALYLALKAPNPSGGDRRAAVWNALSSALNKPGNAA